MSNIDKRALREEFQYMQECYSDPADRDRQVIYIAAEALLDELEAKDKSIDFLKDQLAQLANFNPDWDKLEAATDSLREHMAKLSSAEKRIAEQRGIILSARNFISEYAERGDVGAEGFVSIIDRAAGTAKGE